MNNIFFLGLCVSVVVLVALVALVYVLFNKKPNKVVLMDTSYAKPFNPTKWIVPIIIALVLAFWSIWISFLFIVATGILSLNPAPNSNWMLDDNQKKTAKRVYTWLFWSPIITVPLFIGMINLVSLGFSSTNIGVFAALIPLIFHIPLLIGLSSKNAFVYRHTQQGILLIALRAVLAAVAVSTGDYGILIFLFGNGALWLFGSLFGWSQVSDGKSWLMKRKGETIARMEIKNEKIAAPKSQTIQPDETNLKMTDILNNMNAPEKKIAKEKALQAFQSGIQGEVRKNAVNILSILGEVETF